jgi:hypothetical protein
VNGYTGTLKECNDASVLDHDEHRRADGRRGGFVRLLIYLSILVFAPLIRGEATDKRDLRVRTTQARVVTDDEPGQKNPGKGTLRRSVRARATQAARGAVRAAGWLLNTDETIPPAQDGGDETARQTKRQ